MTAFSLSVNFYNGSAEDSQVYTVPAIEYLTAMMRDDEDSLSDDDDDDDNDEELDEQGNKMHVKVTVIQRAGDE